MSQPNFKDYILNCDEPSRREDDWSIGDAIGAGFLKKSTISKGKTKGKERRIPPSWDLRKGRPWWTIDDQGETGACVGYATARGVLRWHYVENGLIFAHKLPSVRFIWMANKETDEITGRPTTFLEKAGTQAKLALRVVQKYGCVLEELLPMDGPLSPLNPKTFYAEANKLRISSYHNLKDNLKDWRRWIAFQGPLLARLEVDDTWYDANDTGGYLNEFLRATVRGGHAVCIVGYTPEHFIVRNSWGRKWGDKGYGYALDAYAFEAFTDVYGVTMPGDGKPPSTGGGAPGGP